MCCFAFPFGFGSKLRQVLHLQVTVTLGDWAGLCVHPAQPQRWIECFIFIVCIRLYLRFPIDQTQRHRREHMPLVVVVDRPRWQQGKKGTLPGTHGHGNDVEFSSRLWFSPEPRADRPTRRRGPTTATEAMIVDALVECAWRLRVRSRRRSRSNPVHGRGQAPMRRCAVCFFGVGSPI